MNPIYCVRKQTKIDKIWNVAIFLLTASCLVKRCNVSHIVYAKSIPLTWITTAMLAKFMSFLFQCKYSKSFIHKGTVFYYLRCQCRRVMHNAITVICPDWSTALIFSNFCLIRSYVLSSCLVCDSMVFCDFKLFDLFKIDVHESITVQTGYLMIKAYKMM